MDARRLAHELISLLAPPACAACRTAVRAGDEVLCARCRGELPWLRGPRCPRCALPAPCRPCPAARAAWDSAWSPLAYADVARDMVTALKFTGRFAVADAMAALLAANAPAEMVTDTALVPVPLHPARRRTRGLNQAERLARALGARRGLPVRACLIRQGPATRQLGSGRSSRLAAGRLRVVARQAAPHGVTLVDDVHTTGATLEACARALRAAGATRVSCLTFARTLP